MARPASAVLQVYSPDPGTLHLWHFDETATPCLDAVAGGTNLTQLINGATLGNPSFSGGTANFTNSLSFGTLTTPGAVLFPAGSGNVGAVTPFTYAGANGAFTYEALVHVEFDPLHFFRNQPCQIMNCDADNTGARVFQFRLDPVGFAAGGRDTNFVGIEFINGTTTVAVAPIPTNGPDTIVSNAWYHVAVTYNGNANTASNLLFYWTLLDPARTNADCIYGAAMATGLPGVSTSSTVFSIGNSARNPSGGVGADTANFLGRLDEVRISSVARGPQQMVFVPVGLFITSQPTPTSQIIGTGQPLSYSVNASGASLNYQWRHDGAPVNGAVNSTFTIASAQPSDSGNYDVVITNNSYTATSTIVTVAVTNLLIVTQPSSVSATYGSSAAFNVVVTGAQPLFYQWRKNGSPISGATNSTLAFTSLAVGDAAAYDVLVSNSLASLASTVATLTISGPALTLFPVSDGDTASSGYAYAGNSGINTIAFICSGLLTLGNQQFFAYYGRHQTNPAYAFNNTIWIARRTVGTNDWSVFKTTFTADDITDGHDVVAFGIDGGGYMHMSWGMHDQNLHYARSMTPVTGTQPITFGPDLGDMTGNETSVTYPQFLNLPNGDLYFLYRVGASGGGNTFLNRWSLASQTWSNIDLSGGVAEPFIQGLWSNASYNAYPNMPCVDAAGNFYMAWTWRETPAYQSNHDLNFAKSLNGGVTWLNYEGTPYDLPISEIGQTTDAAENAENICPIPQNSSLINQAGMCLDSSNHPVIATWWAPGTATNNFRRQYMVVFPDANGVWQVRQVSNRTNDPPGTLEQDGVVRDLGRPVVVCDRQNRVIVLYRDNSTSNGLTIVSSLPYAVDPQRTNWTAFTLTTDNLGVYEPVIDLARWNRDNVMDIVYQASSGEGYTPNANTASPIGVLEWNASAYFKYSPSLQLALTNQNQNVALTWTPQPGWGYQVQWSTNFVNWTTVATLNGLAGFSPYQYTHTNGAVGPLRFWRLQTKEGGF